MLSLLPFQQHLAQDSTPGCCDLMGYNCVISEVLLPFTALPVHAASTKGQKSPKVVRSHTLLPVWGVFKTGSAGISI